MDGSERGSIKKSPSDSSCSSKDSLSDAVRLKAILDQHIEHTCKDLQEALSREYSASSCASEDIAQLQVEKIKAGMKKDFVFLTRGIDSLQYSRQYLVLAAWLQIQLVEKDKPVLLRKLANKNTWGLAGNLSSEVEPLLVCLQRQDFALHYGIWYSLYKELYAHVLPQDQLLPGSGNNRHVLLPPERLIKRVPLLDLACRYVQAEVHEKAIKTSVAHVTQYLPYCPCYSDSSSSTDEARCGL